MSVSYCIGSGYVRFYVDGDRYDVPAESFQDDCWGVANGLASYSDGFVSFEVPQAIYDRVVAAIS